MAAIIAWWEAEARQLPWRATREIYGVWVAEVMSAQTQIERAAAAWERWMVRWPTVQSLAAASLREVLAQWQGLGYPRRARDLHRAAQVVAGAGWPEDLTELPGIGSYTSAAIRCFAREEPVLPRDVNVERVLARRFPRGVSIERDPWRGGQALMEFGQRICTVRPVCEVCPANGGCSGPKPRAPHPARRQKRFAGSLRQRRGRVLAAVILHGILALEQVDREAALSLAADGLVEVAGAQVRAPG